MDRYSGWENVDKQDFFLAQATTDLDRMTRVRALLNAANDSRKIGDRDHAYRYSLEASRIAPNDPEVWLARAETAHSIEEKLFCLSRLHTLNPYYPAAQRKTYSILREMLREEPFLAYLDETENLYQVRNGPALAVTLPKYRAIPEPYPPPRPGPWPAAAPCGRTGDRRAAGALSRAGARESGAAAR